MNAENINRPTETSGAFTVAPGVWGKKALFVNFYMVRDDSTGNWVLIDAGLKWSASAVKKMARDLFGEDSKPVAIILTHGHFDHVGAVETLCSEWQVPVYAHPLELPYLTGKSSYPPADPTVGGGLMSLLSFMLPSGPCDFSDHIRTLPYDGSVPGLNDWKYFHTPGHTAGHVSLFRESDRVLITGDAFVTTQAESAIKSLVGVKEISGPPKYLTPNWASAKQSVIRLQALHPEVAATGHGVPMRGEELKGALANLVTHFDTIAVPAHGRYVNEPAVTNGDGVLYLPPNPAKVAAVAKAVGVTLAIAAVAVIFYTVWSKRKRSDFSMLSLAGK